MLQNYCICYLLNLEQDIPSIRKITIGTCTREVTFRLQNKCLKVHIRCLMIWRSEIGSQQLPCTISKLLESSATRFKNLLLLCLKEKLVPKLGDRLKLLGPFLVVIFLFYDSFYLII